MGVEPTRNRLTAPSGFEDRPLHRERFSSAGGGQRDGDSTFSSRASARCIWHFSNRRFSADYVHAPAAFAKSARIADTVEEFEDLDRTFTSTAEAIAKYGCTNPA